MSITAIVDIHIKPESVSVAPDELHAILTETRAFNGCRGVEVFVDVADPAHIVMVEVWESEEHDAAYRSWRAGAGKTILGTLIAGPPVSAKFAVAPHI